VKKFKRGDLVEYDFALGLVLEVEDYSCRVLFCDGIEWKNIRHLHEPGPFLKIKTRVKPKDV